MGASERQYKSEMSVNTDPEMLLQTIAGGSLKDTGLHVPSYRKREVSVRGMTSSHIPQQILEMPFMGMDTGVGITSERRSDVLEHADFGANLVSCILYALPNMLPGVITVGSFYVIQQMKVYVIEVWWPW